MIVEIAQKSKSAALELANVSSEKKNIALLKIADLLLENATYIIQENKKDLESAKSAGLTNAMLERLSLDSKKIGQMADGVKQLVKLKDPVGDILDVVVRPNGLSIEKVRVPIGVISIIYESRPNVTIDCASLCLKSGNACILRGGSEAFNTNMALAKLIKQALQESQLNEDCVQIVPSSKREILTQMLKLNELIDCIIPRGGEGLIRFVSENSTIPVIKHYKGVCTAYVDECFDEKMMLDLVVNAKCQRPSVCNAIENLLINKAVAGKYLPKVAEILIENSVEIRASKRAGQYLAGFDFKEASLEDFSTEYTDLILSIEVVDDLDEAIDFINKNGSKHSDLIITNSAENAEKFMNGVDSSTLYWNASTRFTDGFEFGMGAEIGISTDKLHARGPMGLNELCSYKYKVRGTGQIRK